MNKGNMEQNVMRMKFLGLGLFLSVLAIVTACGSDDDELPTTDTDTSDEVVTLTSTSWKLYGYVDVNDNTVTQPIEHMSSSYTVRFSEVDQFDGRSCFNEIGGIYCFEGDSIKWLSAAKTKIGMDKPYSDADEYFFRSLMASFKYEITNRQLRLYYKDTENHREHYMLFNKWSESKGVYESEIGVDSN